ncbi:MAG: hypothetical protein M1813_008295 [Trichoglossum hirsutum]|nr:MAG: hypothetical protein M1813_008295 [Trichoglossum hirsutum]
MQKRSLSAGAVSERRIRGKRSPKYSEIRRLDAILRNLNLDGGPYFVKDTRTQHNGQDPVAVKGGTAASKDIGENKLISGLEDMKLGGGKEGPTAF